MYLCFLCKQRLPCTGMQLISAFVFAYAKYRFSHDMAVIFFTILGTVPIPVQLGKSLSFFPPIGKIGTFRFI